MLDVITEHPWKGFPRASLKRFATVDSGMPVDVAVLTPIIQALWASPQTGPPSWTYYVSVSVLVEVPREHWIEKVIVVLDDDPAACGGFASGLPLAEGIVDAVLLYGGNGEVTVPISLLKLSHNNDFGDVGIGEGLRDKMAPEQVGAKIMGLATAAEGSRSVRSERTSGHDEGNAHGTLITPNPPKLQPGEWNVSTILMPP